MKWEANIKSDPEKKKQYQEYERQRKADQRKKKKQDQQQRLPTTLRPPPPCTSVLTARSGTPLEEVLAVIEPSNTRSGPIHKTRRNNDSLTFL